MRVRSRFLNETLLGQICYGEPSGDAELYGKVRTRLALNPPEVIETHVARRLQVATPAYRDELMRLVLRLAEEQGVALDMGLTHMGVVSDRTGLSLPRLIRRLHATQAMVLARIAVRDTRIAGLLGTPAEGGLLGAIVPQDSDRCRGSGF